MCDGCQETCALDPLDPDTYPTPEDDYAQYEDEEYE